jgi:threonine dehydratase
MASSRSIGDLLGAPVSLKLELMQKTGSFKPRGAFNQVIGLPTEAKAEGVVGVSGGNYAQGLAFAGQRLGVPTRILMPESTPANYVEATRGYGAMVEFAPDMASMFARAERLSDEGLAFLHPFDDPLMMAGNGTLGLEVLEDVPEVTDVFVSIGGGGLMSGVAVAIKEQRPEVRIWGVETVGADAMSLALEAGEIVRMEPTSIAKTLGAPWVSEDTLAAARRHRHVDAPGQGGGGTCSRMHAGGGQAGRPPARLPRGAHPVRRKRLSRRPCRMAGAIRRIGLRVRRPGRPMSPVGRR